MTATEKIIQYIRDNDVNLRALARRTGIPYRNIYRSLGRHGTGRKLSADEYECIRRVIEKRKAG